MARLNLSVPDEVIEAVRRDHPDLNLSAFLRFALDALSVCSHDALSCRACGTEMDRGQVLDAALGSFYRDVMRALEHPVSRAATAEGVARIIKRVAVEHGISAADAPLPRATRAEREAAKDRNYNTEVPAA